MNRKPSDYMALYNATFAARPDLWVLDAKRLADALADGVEDAAKKKGGMRTNFGALSALEAAHALAGWICQLPAYDRQRVLEWLGDAS